MPLLKKILSGIKNLFRKRKFAKRISSRRASSVRIRKSKKKSPAGKVKRISKKVKKKSIKKVKSSPLKKAAAKSLKPAGQLVGEITHYFSKIQVVVIKITQGTLQVGNQIRIEGRGNSFVQKIGSLQIESVDVRSAKKGDLVGMKVKLHAKEGDKVYKLK